MEVDHMYCSQCGKQIADTSKFCSFCGARIDGRSAIDGRVFAEKSFGDQRKLEQDVRKGTLIYLHDVLSMEFSVNKLEHALRMKQSSISIHDDCFFWKRFLFKHPIKGLRNNEFSSGFHVVSVILKFERKTIKFYHTIKEKRTKNVIINKKLISLSQTNKSNTEN